MDPYKVLGLSPGASKEEVKKAYRTLSRRYHPDANMNNPNQEQAEERFKEIQQAYKMIMDDRVGYQSGGYGSGMSGFGSGMGGYGPAGSRQSQSQDALHLQAAANFIQNRRFSEALNVLDGISDRTAQWYFLSAIANKGIGNDAIAMEHLDRAIRMDPENIQYQQYKQYMQSGMNWYMQQGQPFGGMQDMGQTDFCTKLCFTILCCNMCCGGTGLCCPVRMY